MRILTAVTIVLASAMNATAQGTTHKFTPTAGVQTFAVRPPVLRVKPGDTVETQTFSRPGDYYNPEKAGPWPGEVGPFLIEGAEPGDTLVVRILKLTPNRDVAISNVTPNGISGVAGDTRTRMLNDPLPARRFVWRLDRQPHGRHPRSAELGEQAHRSAAPADARARGGRAGRRGSVGRAVAGRLRRQPRRL